MKTLVFSCALACSTIVAAQAAAPIATLRGTVTDPIHHHAVAGAQVEIHTGVHVLRQRTNDRGQFVFAGVSAGRVDLEIAAEGYMSVTVSTCTLPGETRTLPLLVVPQLSMITNTAAAQRYFDRANLPDADAAKAPHASVTTDQYTLGFCA